MDRAFNQSLGEPMKILTLVSMLQTAAIVLLLYETYAPGTIAALVPEQYKQQSEAPVVKRANDPITRREFRYIMRDELARYREATPPPPEVVAKEDEPQPATSSPFRSREDVEALMAVRMKLDSIVAGETLSQDEFNDLESAISKLHEDDRGEMLTELIRALNQGEVKRERSSQ